jgi:hypothetical protein
MSKLKRIWDVLTKPEPPAPVLRHADDLTPGMRIWVECVVFDEPDDYPKGSHVFARPVDWNGGDQHVWFWRGPLNSRPEPWIREARP